MMTCQLSLYIYRLKTLVRFIRSMIHRHVKIPKFVVILSGPEKITAITHIAVVALTR